ncbi:hypothetical protein PRUPE_1G287400 [Prunus persica]|uniref:Auxin-responsive protein n=1 Tax=Prunus persica TaxID=3760 RepID=A0A251R4N5_PRUPE|nr:auxin-responsive protein IAA21-like [Prunus persica]ONI31011.1 hypothetical protein PRUPE_1G287400 [Prunus persica]
MSDNQTEHMSDHLSEQTSIFGLRLWIVLGVCVGAAFVLVLFVISLWLASKRSKNKTLQKPTIPIVSKEIQEIRVDHVRTQVQAYPYPEPDPIPRIERQALLTPTEDESPARYQKVHIETQIASTLSLSLSLCQPQLQNQKHLEATKAFHVQETPIPLLRVKSLGVESNGKTQQLCASAQAKKEVASVLQSPKPVLEKKTQVSEHASAPAAKAQVVGWPPIRSFRKNSMASNLAKNNDDAEGKQGSGCLWDAETMVLLIWTDPW